VITQPDSRPDPIGAGDRVLVTGADGFIGSAVTRTLLADGAQVVATVEPGSRLRNLSGLPIEPVECDVRRSDMVREAVKGCRAVFHVAAVYRFWVREPKLFYEVNVGGTRNVLDSAAAEGVERVVYTSTVGTLGLEGATLEGGADERTYPDLSHLFGSYKRSKYVAEHEVLRAAAEGLPATLVLPTFPLGPGDTGPTPTGRVVVDFLHGRLPAYVDTVLNVVHVDDVARGHVLAFNHGRQGRSYILGGENLTMKMLLSQLASVAGRKAPTRRVPRGLALGAAWLSENFEGRLLKRPPAVPLEAARMSTTAMAFDDSRARAELGHASRPASEAIADSVRWFVENGYAGG
jgi:dihydroflavonol-4-reductase